MLYVARSAVATASPSMVPMDKLRWLVDAYVSMTPEHRAALDTIITTLVGSEAPAPAPQAAPASRLGLVRRVVPLEVEQPG